MTAGARCKKRNGAGQSRAVHDHDTKW